MSGIAERLAEVLAEHVKECSSNGCEVCDCDDFEPEFGRVIADDEGWNAWLEHVAQALLPVVEREIAAARGEAWLVYMQEAQPHVIREAKREAWDFGYACGLGDYGKGDGETYSANPYRAALSPDPDRGEGEA